MTQSRDQVSGGGEQKLVAGQKCATAGCNAMAWGDDFCARCEEEIRALERMAEDAELREARIITARYLRRVLERKERIKRFRRTGMHLRRWIWLPNLIFVAAGVVYLALVCGQAVIEWLR